MSRYAFACWHWTAATIKEASHYAQMHPDTHLIVAWQQANRPQGAELQQAFELMTRLFAHVSFVNVPVFSWAVNSALAWRAHEAPLRGHPLVKPYAVEPDLKLQAPEYLGRLDNMRKLLAQRADPEPSRRLEAYLTAFRALTPKAYTEAEYVEWLRQFFSFPPNEPCRLHALRVLELVGLSREDAAAYARVVAGMQAGADGKPMSPGESSVRWLGKFITPTAGCQSDVANLLYAFHNAEGPPQRSTKLPKGSGLATPEDAMALELELVDVVKHAPLTQFPGLRALFMDAEHDDIRVECLVVGQGTAVYVQARKDVWDQIGKFHRDATWICDPDARNSSVVLQAHNLE